MANLKDNPSFDDVYQLERNDPIDAGENGDGIANRQAQQLANRTRYLKEEIDGLEDVAKTGRYEDLKDKPDLGGAAFKDTSHFASAEQGQKADNAIASTEKSQANGVAELDENGLLFVENLPSAMGVATLEETSGGEAGGAYTPFYISGSGAVQPFGSDVLVNQTITPKQFTGSNISLIRTISDLRTYSHYAFSLKSNATLDRESTMGVIQSSFLLNEINVLCFSGAIREQSMFDSFVGGMGAEPKMTQNIQAKDPFFIIIMQNAVSSTWLVDSGMPIYDGGAITLEVDCTSSQHNYVTVWVGDTATVKYTLNKTDQWEITGPQYFAQCLNFGGFENITFLPQRPAGLSAEVPLLLPTAISNKNEPELDFPYFPYLDRQPKPLGPTGELDVEVTKNASTSNLVISKIYRAPNVGEPPKETVFGITPSFLLKPQALKTVNIKYTGDFVGGFPEERSNLRVGVVSSFSSNGVTSGKEVLIANEDPQYPHRVYVKNIGSGANIIQLPDSGSSNSDFYETGVTITFSETELQVKVGTQQVSVSIAGARYIALSGEFYNSNSSAASFILDFDNPIAFTLDEMISRMPPEDRADLPAGGDSTPSATTTIDVDRNVLGNLFSVTGAGTVPAQIGGPVKEGDILAFDHNGYLTNLSKPAAQNVHGLAQAVQAIVEPSLAEKADVTELDLLKSQVQYVADLETELGDSETTAMSQKAVTDELINLEESLTTELQNYADTQADEAEQAAKDYADQQLENKVNKEEGKELSSNDFTNELKQKLEGIESGGSGGANNALLVKNFDSQTPVSIVPSSFGGDKNKPHVGYAKVTIPVLSSMFQEDYDTPYTYTPIFDSSNVFSGARVTVEFMGMILNWDVNAQDGEPSNPEFISCHIKFGLPDLMSLDGSNIFGLLSQGGLQKVEVDSATGFLKLAQ